MSGVQASRTLSFNRFQDRLETALPLAACYTSYLHCYDVFALVQYLPIKRPTKPPRKADVHTAATVHFVNR